jgi:hypothetical protein
MLSDTIDLITEDPKTGEFGLILIEGQGAEKEWCSVNSANISSR